MTVTDLHLFFSSIFEFIAHFVDLGERRIFGKCDPRRYSQGRTIEILVGKKEEVGGLVVSDLSLPRKESYPQVDEQSGKAGGTAEERSEEDRGTRLRQAR